ncbi:MAG: SoxR reducing system RseC family protein [Clostridia bacterium]|nr:SoxR reducing system RseC family protein [Clostridia bacterium]
MLRTAEVISVEGEFATVRAERSSMCDGCEKQGCDGSCSAGMLAGAGKSVTAKAVNTAGAEVGDTVEIETSDAKVLSYAALVFIMPIVVCALFFAAAEALFSDRRISVAAAVLGFILTFAVIGIVEKRHAKKLPDIEIVRVVEKNGSIKSDN